MTRANLIGRYQRGGFWLAITLLGCGLAGCDDGASSSADVQPMDATGASDGGLLDGAAFDASAADAALTCLNISSDWEGVRSADPRLPAAQLRADLDADSDGVADLLTVRTAATGLRVVTHRGRDLAQLASAEMPGAERIDFMPDVFPQRSLVAPFPADGVLSWAWLEHRQGADSGVRIVTADALTRQRFLTIEGGLSAAQIFNASAEQTWILGQTPQGDCVLFDPASSAAVNAWPNCKLQPVWDLDGDGVLDLARAAAGGTVVLSGESLEVIAQRPGHSYFGFGAVAANNAGGSLTFRDTPEVLAMVLDAGRLSVHYLDPTDLQTNTEALVIPGIALDFDFVPTASGLSLLIKEDRGGTTFLNLYEITRQVRLRAEWGPHTNIKWGLGPDLDGDGQREFWLRGGPRPDFTRADLSFIDTKTGQVVWKLDGQRSAVFEPVWWGARFTDLDGCEGQERVVLRRGLPNDDGISGTRMFVFDEAGREIWRGPPVSTVGHLVALADLDGDGDAELIEWLDTGSGGVWVARSN